TTEVLFGWWVILSPAITLTYPSVKHGGSLTIPCFYDGKYKSNLKYWCRGYYWSTCKTVAYINTSGGTSVTDDPTQNMFTVELKSLQDSDSGYYWCAVEIGGTGTPDDKDYLYLTVSAGKKSLSLLPCSSVARTPMENSYYLGGGSFSALQ
uniref:Ig-like domain-containing protein n=1 Tax=Pygocentrus nattereri TaxID=42514 RepID=A0A3B4DXP0_PYGNA